MGGGQANLSKEGGSRDINQEECLNRTTESKIPEESEVRNGNRAEGELLVIVMS